MHQPKGMRREKEESGNKINDLDWILKNEMQRSVMELVKNAKKFSLNESLMLHVECWTVMRRRK